MVRAARIAHHVCRETTTISSQSLTPAPNVEPLPGYRLIERLGRGGFGEVWKAEAPGGLHKAIKFVYGDMDATDDSDLAEQELKSLSRIKSIRHPYILSIERFDVVEGQLLIVMELADRNLWDRFRECRTQGLPGIPKAELIGYMDEAAEALDLMNSQYNLQHLDIKPQNLFLVYNHVKIADFGLVKDFEGKRGTITGGVTPVYAAPETFDGWVSRNSDQYSLAIVYQELLTGQRPFNGTMARQLVLQHLQAPPDVSSLPECDRPIIQRALAKKPDDRFPSCAALVQALFEAGAPATSNGVAAPAPIIVEERREEASGIVSGIHTAPANPRSLQDKRGSATQVRPRDEAQPAFELPPVVSYEADETGVLVPSLVIGLGGVGSQVLRLFRRALADRYGVKSLPHIRMMAADTDPASLRALTHEQFHGQALTADELFHTGLGRPSRYLRGDLVAGIDTWLGHSTLYRLPKNPGAAELRAFGRLAFLDHAANFARRIRTQLEACRHADALAESNRVTHLGVRNTGPRVYIVAGLAGGTGGGMFIDAAYLARSILSQLGEAAPQVIGLLLLPPCDRLVGPSALANAHAALMELNHFGLPTTVYSARFEPKQPAVNDANPAFQRAMLMPLADPTNEKAAQAALGQASGWLMRELMTPVGAAAERHRDAMEAARPSERPVVQTAATYQFAWPRERTARLAARHLGRLLLNRWMAKDGGQCRATVTNWVEEQWDAQGISPERLAEKIHDRVTSQLGKPALDQVERLAAPLAENDFAESTPDAFHDVFDRICHLMGPPDPCFTKVMGGRIVPMMEKARAELSRECDKLVADLATRAVELPGMRIVGAEEVAKQVSEKAKNALGSYESLTESLTKEVAEEAKKLAQMIINLDRQQLSAKKREPVVRAMFDLVRSFPKKQYQSMLAKTLRDTYRGMLGTMPDYLQEMNLCRERPAEVIKELDRRTSAEADFDVALGPGRSLLPGGDSSADEFAKRLAAELTEQEILAADAAMQAQIDERFHGLVNFCLGNGPKAEHLADVMEATCEEFFLKRLAHANPADLLQDYDLADVLKTAIRDGHPPLATPECGIDSLVTIVTRPPSQAGDRVYEAVSQELNGAGVASCECQSEVLLYRELRQLPITRLPHMGQLAREAYQKALAEGLVLPHSRLDIIWQPVN